MTAPFDLAVALRVPSLPSVPVELQQFVSAGIFDSRVELEVVLPITPGTKNIDFGSVPAAGAKMLVVFYEAMVAAPPIQLTLNGGDEPLELASGGFLVLASPVPVAGVTSLAIAHTGLARVRIWLLG